MIHSCRHTPRKEYCFIISKNLYLELFIKLNPQQESAEAEMYWLQMADFYDWPHIQVSVWQQLLLKVSMFQDLNYLLRSNETV